MHAENTAQQRARAEIAALFGRVQGHSGANYVGHGPWYLATGQLGPTRAGRRLLRPELPGLGPKVYLRLIANRALGREVPLPLNNSVLQVAESGARIRAFEPGLDVSRKLVNRASKYGRGVATDLDVRRGLLAEAGVRHPVVRSTGEVSGHVLIEEELVRGRRFHPRLDGRLTHDHLVEPLSRLHATAGLRTLALSEALGRDTVHRVLALEADTGFVRRARELIERDPRVTVAFGHGDLLPSNLAVERAGVVFLDWETAGYAPVGFDLLRLWRKYPRVRALARGAGTLIRRHQAGRLDLYDTACLQLALGLLGARKAGDPTILRHLPTAA